jgi:hypothetical protein
MALDLKAWLIEQGVPAVKVDDIIPMLAATPFATNVEKSIGTIDNLTLRAQQVKDRETALATAQAAHADAEQRLNLEMVDWAEKQNAGGAITEQMRRDMAAAQAEVTRLKSIVTSKATELGLDPKTIIGDPDPAPQPQPHPAPGPAGITDEVLNQRLGSYAQFQMMLAREMPRLQHEHQELTGEWLDPGTIISEFESRASDTLNRDRATGQFKKPLDLRAIWEEKFAIPAKRAARDAATREAEREAAREEGRQEMRSQQALPGQAPQGRHSPVLRSAGDPANVSKAPRPSQAAVSDRVSKAASALATHKYRQAGTQPAAAGGR